MEFEKSYIYVYIKKISVSEAAQKQKNFRFHYFSLVLYQILDGKIYKGHI